MSQVVQEYAPLSESCFRHIFPDGNRIRKLDASQVRQLVQLFVSSGQPGRPTHKARAQQQPSQPSGKVSSPTTLDSPLLLYYSYSQS